MTDDPLHRILHRLGGVLGVKLRGALGGVGGGNCEFLERITDDALSFIEAHNRIIIVGLHFYKMIVEPNLECVLKVRQRNRELQPLIRPRIVGADGGEGFCSRNPIFEP